MTSHDALRAAMPGPLCPNGFDPVCEYLIATDAPKDVFRALERARHGAETLRAVARDAIRRLERAA